MRRGVLFRGAPSGLAKGRDMQQLLSRLLPGEGLTEGESTALLLRIGQGPDGHAPQMLRLDTSPSMTPLRVASPPPSQRPHATLHDGFQRAEPYEPAMARRPPQRVLDAEGNPYALIESDGRLTYLGDETPPCLFDAGCCLTPCWCDVGCVLPLLYWCASGVCCARNEHFWFAMSRLR